MLDARYDYPSEVTCLNRKRSSELYARARQYIPGGVNSPARSWRAVGGEPLFISRGAGSKVWDADGNQYIDYVASWGPLVLGHAHPEVIEAIKATAERGTSFGAPTELENELARLVVESFPSMELVRFVNSGTEATMSALRLARAFTGRDRTIKFEGGYHGHADALLVAAGLPASFARDTLVAQYNDLDSVERYFRAYPDGIACVIVEPVAGNMGVVPPLPGFLQGLRELAARHGALLIFDEVITGFRVALGGAQERYGVMPDLTTLGKIIGGGFPVGAFGGKREIMERLAPVGPVYQAGTLSGNPVAMVAGLALIEALKQPGVYDELERLGARLEAGLRAAVEDAGVEACLTRVGSMACMFFTGERVRDWATAATSDTERYARYFRGMLERGIMLAPSQFEATFVGLAHTDADVDAMTSAAAEVLKALR